MSSKNKLLCLGSVLLGFYLISNLLPFPGFIDEVFIIALAFPFFNRKLRIRITTAVQVVGFFSFVQHYIMAYMKYGNILAIGLKNLFETGSVSSSNVNLIPESISQTGSKIVESMWVFDQFELVFRTLYPVSSFVAEILFHGIIITGFLLYGAALTSVFLIGLTAPYSIYLIIEKLGFYRLVERNTKGLINFKEWTQQL